MSIRNRLGAAGVLSWTLLLGACVSLPPNAPRSKADPWESFNRGVYKFNDSLDRHIAKPVARGYVKVVPHPIRTGVHNFFTNLQTPVVMVNDGLQARFRAAGTDLGRFLMNTVVGIGGILDPATSAGLDKNQNDFGRTLGVWGLHPGPFLEIPLLGPSDVRDAVGRAGDVFTSPQHWVSTNAWISYGLYLPQFVDERAELLPLDQTLKNAFDPYVFIRDAYLEHRAYVTGQSKANELPLEDPDADLDKPSSGTPAPGTAPASGAAPGGTGAPTPLPPPEAPAAPPVSPPTSPPPDAGGAPQPGPGS